MSNDSVFRNARSIGIATGVYSVSFGVLSVAAGLSVAQTCVLSLVTFTGASQFTFVSVIGAGGSIVGRWRRRSCSPAETRSTPSASEE